MIGWRGTCYLALAELGEPHAKQNRSQSRISMPASRLKFAQKTSGLLKGLRSKHSKLQDATKEQKASVKVLASSDHRENEQALEQERRAGTSANSVLGKRRRYYTRSMPNDTVAVHEDAAEIPSHARQTSKMSSFRQTASVPPEVLFDHDSDCSESDQEVDDSVLEDMRKLEESFTGISQRYRLLNRIGEGMNPSVCLVT
jgi:hypothetical protein